MKLIIAFSALLLTKSLFSQMNKAVIIKTNHCVCKENDFKLDSALVHFCRNFDRNFLSEDYKGKKSIDTVLKDYKLFFDKQFRIKNFINSCCVKFCSLQENYLSKTDSITANNAIFEFTFASVNDVKKIENAFNEYKHKQFITEAPFFFKYLIKDMKVYIASTNRIENLNNEESIMNQILLILEKATR